MNKTDAAKIIEKFKSEVIRVSESDCTLIVEHVGPFFTDLILEFVSANLSKDIRFYPSDTDPHVQLAVEIEETFVEWGRPEWTLSKKPVVDECKQAMESVLTKIAGEFGTPVGDVFSLAEAIHDFKEQHKGFAEHIVEDSFLREANNSVVIEAREYLESLEADRA